MGRDAGAVVSHKRSGVTRAVSLAKAIGRLLPTRIVRRAWSFGRGFRAPR